jgi:hypothetical protein
MVVRVAEVGHPAFQLRPGEAGISVFDTEAVDPPLEEQELLSQFRTGSLLVEIDPTLIERLKLQIIPVEGADVLPERLRRAHAEIRPEQSIERREFKRLLKELQRHVH